MSEKRQRTEYAAVRMTPAEKAAITALMEREGYASIGACMRQETLRIAKQRI